jgi:hypothetical protein
MRADAAFALALISRRDAPVRIDLLFLSCNRLHYTKHSMPALLAD